VDRVLLALIVLSWKVTILTATC